MLLYSRNMDPYHAVFRLSTLVYLTEIEVIELDRLRIYDFFMSNPYSISKMRLPNDLSRNKNIFKKYQNSFNNYSEKSLFDLMKPYQDVAINYLVNVGVLRVESSGRFTIDKDMLSESILEVINKSECVDADVFEFIRSVLQPMSLLGERGLKYASKLMSNKYDAI